VPETAMLKPQQEYRRCVAETFKDLPPSAVLVIDSLLSLEPEARGTAASALRSEVSVANSSH
jgi:cyclin-dependent kinase 12/13